MVSVGETSINAVTLEESVSNSSLSIDKNINELKSTDLKSELKKRGLPIYGKKSDLIKRLVKYGNPGADITDEKKEKTVLSNKIVKNKTNKSLLKSHKFKSYMHLATKINYLEKRLKILEVMISKLRKNVKGKSSAVKSNISIKRSNSSTANKIPLNPSEKIIKKSFCTINEQIKPEVEKSKIFIIADNNGRDCVNILKNTVESKEKYIISAFYKPNARFEDVVSNLTEMGKDLGKADHIIVFAGTINALRGTAVDEIRLRNIFNGLKNTNISIIGIPYCKNRLILNRFIFDINLKLAALARTLENVRYIDTNKFLSNNGLVNYSPAVKYITKKAIIESIYDKIIVNKFINYSNLKQINLSCEKYSEITEEALLKGYPKQPIIDNEQLGNQKNSEFVEECKQKELTDGVIIINDSENFVDNTSDDNQFSEHLSSKYEERNELGNREREENVDIHIPYNKKSLFRE